MAKKNKTIKKIQKAAKKVVKKIAKSVKSSAKKVSAQSTKKAAPKTTAKKTLTKPKAKVVAAKSANRPGKKIAAAPSQKMTTPAFTSTPKKAAQPKTAPMGAPETMAIPNAPTDKTYEAPRLGAKIPPLALENIDGYKVNLNDLAEKNRHLVLYFYPKDDTPGCTKEACDFRDRIENLTRHGATVIGVSPDTKESHQNFANKYELNFTLLADPNHELAEQLGVWKSKQFMGNSYMGVERSTFLFTDGKLTKVWSPVKVDGHVDEVIQAIETKA